MKLDAMSLGLIILTTAGGVWQCPAAAEDGRPSAITKWEYRVVKKDQLIDLGKADLAAGLNKLGEEGWELVLVDGPYVFKRSKDQIRRQVVDIKRWIALLESDVETLKDRAAWAERMGKKGFMSEQQLNAERMRLRAAEIALEEARGALKALPTYPRELIEKDPKSDK